MRRPATRKVRRVPAFQPPASAIGQARLTVSKHEVLLAPGLRDPHESSLVQNDDVVRQRAAAIPTSEAISVKVLFERLAFKMASRVI